jgi:Apea-like HEPN
VCEVANDHCAAFRDSLAKQICAIIADLKKLGEENFFDLPPIARRKKKSGMIIFPSPSPLFVYGLVGENLTRFYKLVDEVANKKWWHNQLSWQHVHNTLRDVIKEVLQCPDEAGTDSVKSSYDIEIARNRLDKVLKQFYQEASQEWTVYTPLVGIQISSKKTIHIGKAELIAVNDTLRDSLRDKVSSILSSTRNPPKSEDGLAQAAEHFLVGFDLLSTTACAVYRIRAEENKANEIAEEESTYILDLLRYYAYNYEIGHEMAMGLQGEFLSGHRSALLLSASDGRVVTHLTRTGAMHTLEFPPNDETAMREIGFFQVSDIIKKKQRSEIEQAILDGLHWFAISQVQTKKEIELVSLTMCLENFLTTEKKGKAEAISEGCAILLEGDLKARKQLKKQVVQIYDCRSEIVHGGFVQRRVSRSKTHSCRHLGSHLEDLRAIANDVIITLIKRSTEFKTRDELRSWIEDQKLSPC